MATLSKDAKTFHQTLVGLAGKRFRHGSTRSPRPSPACTFARSGKKRLFGRVAKAQQHRLSLILLRGLQKGKRLANSCETKVSLPIRTLDAIQERRQLDELAAGVHEIQVKNLIARHCLEGRLIFRGKD